MPKKLHVWWCVALKINKIISEHGKIQNDLIYLEGNTPPNMQLFGHFWWCVALKINKIISEHGKIHEELIFYGYVSHIFP